MKKIVIYVSCLLFALSCSNYEEQTETFNGEVKNDIPSLRSAGDGGYDALGYGYDVSGAYLDSKSVKDTVIDINRLATDYPDRVDYNASTYGYYKYIYGYNAEDYLSELTKEVPDKFKADFALVKDLKLFSGTFLNDDNFKSVVSHSSLYMFASCEVVKNVKRIYINADVNLLKNYLTPSFVQALNTKSADEIIQMYGTHVLTDFTIGGRYNFMFRSMANTSMTNTAKREAVKEGANYSFMKMGILPDPAYVLGGATQEMINRYNNDNKYKGLYIVSYGGDGENSFYNLETESPPTLNTLSWEQSVNKNNAALTEINWDKAIPIWEFASNPTQSEALKAAAINHVENNMIHCVELLPLIEWLNTAGISYYFFAGAADSPYFPNLMTQLYLPNNGYYYFSNKIAGYMLRNQEEGSKPLYLFVNNAPNSLRKFLYTTNRDIQTDYLYIGFLGYVYTEQKPETSYPFPNEYHPNDTRNIEGETFYIYTPN